MNEDDQKLFQKLAGMVIKIMTMLDEENLGFNEALYLMALCSASLIAESDNIPLEKKEFKDLLDSIIDLKKVISGILKNEEK